MKNTSIPDTPRQPFAARGVAPFWRFVSIGLALALALGLASTSLAARADTSTKPHATAPATSSGHRASAASADANARTALPRLVAIAPPDDDDDIPRFALYAARDIEQLGLQFPAEAANASPDVEVVITMSLRESASTRMRDFSRQHMNEPMTLIVDGVEMLTATIRSELGGKFQLQMPKEKARLLFQRVLAKAGPAT